MLTLKTIIKNAGRFGGNRLALANATVKASSLKFGPVKKERLVRALCRTWSEKTPEGRWQNTKYTTVIDFVSPRGYVYVTCSCPDFCFRFEYALAQKDAAVIYYCNGEHPGIRNPSLIPGCCKHIIRLGNLLISKGKLGPNYTLI